MRCAQHLYSLFQQAFLLSFLDSNKKSHLIMCCSGSHTVLHGDREQKILFDYFLLPCFFTHSFISHSRNPNQATQPLDMELVKTQQQNTILAIQVTKYNTCNTDHKNTIHNNHTYKTQFPREQFSVSPYRTQNMYKMLIPGTQITNEHITSQTNNVYK